MEGPHVLIEAHSGELWSSCHITWCWDKEAIWPSTSHGYQSVLHCYIHPFFIISTCPFMSCTTPCSLGDILSAYYHSNEVGIWAGRCKHGSLLGRRHNEAQYQHFISIVSYSIAGGDNNKMIVVSPNASCSFKANPVNINSGALDKNYYITTYYYCHRPQCWGPKLCVCRCMFMMLSCPSLPWCHNVFDNTSSMMNHPFPI